MIAVIADDITGAAEMAGIAHRFGLRVMLTTSYVTGADTDVMVIATDTRSMTADEAVAETRRVAGLLASDPSVSRIFKKTDSALRGHVVDELEALINALPHYDEALYIPANPSKGRVIRDGIYYIGPTPLHETDFSFDPEFPAVTSSLDERFPGHLERGVRFADATDSSDIDAALSATPATTLPAGAADLFTSFLRLNFPQARQTDGTLPDLNMSDLLIVCGSTQSKAIDCGAVTSYMPVEVYDGLASGEEWAEAISPLYARTHSLILAMNHRHRTGHEAAVYLRSAMASAVASLMETHRPAELIIEGGATAFAILSSLGWNSFTITDQIAPGVIRMATSDGTHITMKPGSYPWGNLFPAASGA